MTGFNTLRIGAALLSALVSSAALAEDVELFFSNPGDSGAPNVLFILDNGANWSRQSQNWAFPDDPPSNQGPSQGQAELKAIRLVLANIKKPVNVGLMMLTERGQVGGYVRFGIRPMLEGKDLTDSNIALQQILNEVYSKTQNPLETVPKSKDNYANAMYESWLYITGGRSWAGTAPSNKQDNGDLRDYASNTSPVTAKSQRLISGWAYASGVTNAQFNKPIGDDFCGSTYIVFIGNNRTSGTGGMPDTPKPTDPAVKTLDQYKLATPPTSFVQATWARFLYTRPDRFGSPPPGVDPFAWAKAGSVVTHTIDAYQAQDNPEFTRMMKNVASAGGGQYYGVTNSKQLLDALNDVISSITEKDSVFAAVSLPISVNQRGTFLNQVYLGVFRPALVPNWPGNLKLYEVGIDDSTKPATLFLADQFGRPAASADGFILPNATSHWTSPSAFWDATFYPASQGVGGTSDAPDGDLVEKGGVAQLLRERYKNDQSQRSVYTCTGSCTKDSALSATPFATSNGDVLDGDPQRTEIIDWVRGGNNRLNDPPSGLATDVRGFVHGDVLHSRPAVINFGGAEGEEVIYVFYGSNDGMLRAVRGGTDKADGAGQEAWAFIAPEHFGQLKRLRDGDPKVSYVPPRTPKPYFIDGSPTAYSVDANGDRQIKAADGDKAYLFLNMRRGGRFIYALDVTDPTAPKMLWKRDFVDFGELGQTWSDIRVARINASADPVLIFGLGYDAAGNDRVVAGVNTQGRGVIVVNALTGDKIWSSADVSGMFGIEHSIAAGVAVLDSDNDGRVDRVIAADTGANVWRFNIDDPDTGKWTVRKIASLGTGDGAGARRFINAPDVVLATAQGPGWDSILIGSGDREQPFDKSVVNRFYMLKDNQAKTYLWENPLTEADLYDATNNLVQQGDSEQRKAAALALEQAQGWYITLGEGEKVVGPSTTLSGTTFFGTNTPTNPVPGACVSPLGDARAYAISFLDAGATGDINRDKVLDAADRAQIVGVGFPPPPVALQIEGKDGTLLQGIAFGTQIIQPPGTAFGRRFRSWWFQRIDR